MKLEVLLSYDDRKREMGAKPIRYHRKSIGVEEGAENSIYTHIYPNPGKWNQLVIYFKEDGIYVIAVAKIDIDENLVTRNKKSLTKLGEDLVKAGLEEKIKEIFNGKNISNPIVNHLKPDLFAKLIFDYNDGNLVFKSGTIRQIHPSFPKGLPLNPKVEL